MLFNSPEFLFLFLPICLIVFWKLIRNETKTYALTSLLICSFFFYSYWNPKYFILIASSIIVNYLIGKTLACNQSHKNNGLFYFGIVFNLLLLGYYKYFNFFKINLNAFFGTTLTIWDIFLPLGVSFFTFQQITYLMVM